MSKIDRRTFIKTGVAGVGLSVFGSGLTAFSCAPPEIRVDKVLLGNSGLTISRVGMGTGTVGGNKESNQTRLGLDAFVNMARHAYDRGIRFFDMADSYGSQPFVGKAIKGLPREEITLLTKIWTRPDNSGQLEPVDNILDRVRKELDSDYIDILFMHCMTEGGWSENRRHYMDGLSKAKQDGLVKAVGVSCHNIQALDEAAGHPWVDVIMARINPFGTNMDGSPEAVKAILEKARKNGKGVIGMKIFGEGKHITEEERERSITFALAEGHIHCMTLGLESEAQVDDAVERVMRIRKTIEKSGKTA